MVALLLRNNINLFPARYLRLSRHALAVVNSKAYFPVDNKTDVPFLDCIFDGCYWHSYSIMKAVRIASFAQFYQSVDRLVKAGYIEQDKRTKLYHITLAGRYFLIDFNNTLESLMHANVQAIADCLDNQ